MRHGKVTEKQYRHEKQTEKKVVALTKPYQPSDTEKAAMEAAQARTFNGLEGDWRKAEQAIRKRSVRENRREILRKRFWLAR